MASFDVVSRIEIPEVDNAIQGALREISTRFDFKGSNCSIERDEEKLLLTADDDLKLRQVQELLRGYWGVIGRVIMGDSSFKVDLVLQQVSG